MPMKVTWRIVSGLLVATLACPPAFGQPPLSASDVALIDRVTWGASPSAEAEFQRLGRDRWLEAQLHPAPGEHLPPPIQAQIASMTISRRPMGQLVRDSDGANRFASVLPTPELRSQAQGLYQQGMTELAREAQARSLLRDVYSGDQLKEQMTWFWLNHFNVQAGKDNIRAMVGDFENAAIRPHALGRFRDLLEATLRHPAMLRYLDNADNAAGHINENYARELMELHTMGVGSGYTQADVQQLARILTGVGIDQNPNDPKVPPLHAADLIHIGLFEFNPARHDYSDKVLLGRPIKGRGFAEVEQALDILCREPATARRVSTELAQYFVSDNPPPALIDAMAATWARTSGDIAQVLDTLFHSPAFRASLGTKFKDPMHYAISAVRLAYGGRLIENTAPLQNWIAQLSEPLYGHETPDGYAMTAAAWDAPGQMAQRFEIARQISGGAPALFKPAVPAPTAQPAAQPAPAAGPPQLQFVSDRSLRPLSPQTSAALDQAASQQEWDALFLSSPEFMRR
jgi:uncharacterized protein (DUF1800 family)